MSSTAIPVADLAASTRLPLLMSSLRRRALAVTYSWGDVLELFRTVGHKPAAFED
jgi:hypothetical protein